MRPTFRYIILLAIVLLAVSFSLPRLFRGPYPHPPGPTLDKAVSKLYQHEIEQQHPVLVLLGDSLLTKDVDAPTLQTRLRLPTYKLDIPGSSSALWYLVEKSNIVPANPAPRYLLILFRDTILTAPAFRTTGPYFGLIDKFASPNDTLLLERAYLSQIGPVQAALESYFPPFTYRSELRESIDSGLRHIAPRLTGCDSACADDAMQKTLGDIQPDIFAASIIQAEQALYTPEQLDFPAQVDRSFLPEIIRLAQEHGIQLILVRAPVNVFSNPADVPPGLGTYVAGLGSYLAEKHVPMFDLSQVEGIGPSQFTDPHHMTLEGKAIFTEALARALEEYINSTASSN